MPYVDETTLENSLARLHGSAGHLLKIWLVLKHMGLDPQEPPVRIDTKNSESSLERLFDFGEGGKDRRFFVPFAHTKRYSVMKGDAARSIIQTNIVRWGTSGSVVTCDPTDFLNIRPIEDSRVEVLPKRSYPLGLGHDESGFALKDGSRVAVPLRSFAVWYGRQTEIPTGEAPRKFLVDQLLSDLNISSAERELVFVEDQDLEVTISEQAISHQRLRAICQPYLDGNSTNAVEVVHEDYKGYLRRIQTMTSQLDRPAWLRPDPAGEMNELQKAGASAILLYGPPRTGKTRLIDNLVDRTATERSTIQIHDGWTYEHLVEGFMPDEGGNWNWESGQFKRAIDEGKTFIVIEEINRTEITQALGEIFSLIEPAYRGTENALTLRSGGDFYIPKEVTVLMTMNTVDKSTEEVDDALLGRLSSVEVLPSVESLSEMLEEKQTSDADRKEVCQVFASIQDIYPLGHGYFADLPNDPSPAQIRLFFKTRIRPVLWNFLGELREDELAPIDNLMDQLFGSK